MNARTKSRRGRRGKVPAPYRSWFEHDVADYFTNRGVEFKYEGLQVEFLSIPRKGQCLDCGSTSVGLARKYTPDFVLSNDLVVECKGKFDPPQRTKILSVLYSDNELTEENFRMLFQRNNWTTKARKLTYLDWCDKYKIEAAVFPNIPRGWLK